ncbi:MAG: VIT family protein [Synechococcaceae cyanobacterium]
MRRHPEGHNSHRIGWLRAAVLGANDGTISVASLVVGIAAAGTGREAILLAAIAATVAGAMSMAAGEFVSVQSQADTERADLAKERQELCDDPAGELAELTGIYMERGLPPALARQVAAAMTLHDALGAHAREELGLSEVLRARPVQAALASAGSFALGSLVPLAAVLLSPREDLSRIATLSALVALTLLGGAAAWAGGAPLRQGALRMLLWGALAMGLTAVVGRLSGAVI